MALRTGNGEMQIVLRVKDDGTAVIEKFGKTSEKALGETKQNTDETSVAWKGMANTIVTAAAVYATAAAVMVKNAIDTADATGKTADKLGVTAEALSALAFTAKLADVSQESLNQNLQLMTRNLSDAARGGGMAKDAISELGLSARQLAALSPDRQFAEIAQALEKIPNQGDRARISMDIFGRSGAEMLNIMKGGKQALKEGGEEAARFGQIISTKTAVDAKIFNDNLTKMAALATGAANELAAKMLPTLVNMTNQFLEVNKSAGFFVGVLSAFGAATGVDARDRIQEIDINIARLDERIVALNEEAKSPGFLDRWLGSDPTGLMNEIAAAIDKLRDEKNGLEASEAMRAKNAAELAAPTAQNISPGVDPKAFAPDFFDPAGFAAQAEEKQSALFAALGMENELIQADYVAKQDMATNAYMLGQISQEQFFAGSEFLERQHQEKLAAAQEAAANKKYGSQSAWISRTQALMKMDFNSQLQGASTLFGMLSGLMASKNKKDFDLGKKAAIANAYVQTYLGMARALGEGGPFMGPILAGIVFKLGMMNVQNIKAQEFGGGAGGAAIPTYAALPGTDFPAPAMPGDFMPPPAMNLPAAPRVINLTVQSDSGMVSLAWLQDRFAPVLNEALGDGLILNIK